MGVLADLIERELGIRTSPHIRTESVTATAEVVLKANPDRIAFILFNLGSNDGHINFTSEVSATNGLVVSGNGGFLSMTWRDDLHLVGLEWYGFQQTAPANWLILEVVGLAA